MSLLILVGVSEKMKTFFFPVLLKSLKFTVKGLQDHCIVRKPTKKEVQVTLDCLLCVPEGEGG